MKVCLAAPSSRKKEAESENDCKYWLESYYSMTKWLIPIIKKSEMFMLDSGAFSFMTGSTTKNGFDEYVDSYARFINENDIQYFFELDIDSIVGLDGVEDIRHRLEKETGKRAIPVWHKSRGKDYFIRMCNEYDYVAIGGIVTREITPNEYPYFHWFINTAHSYGAKIHGLGFTNTILLHEYHFDSVDSTAWCSGSRFGQVMLFDGKQMITLQQNNRRLPHTANTINRICFEEWVKFQHYADEYL